MNKLITIYESATNGSHNAAGLSVRMRFSFLSFSTPLLMCDSCNGRCSTEVWRRHLEWRSVGTQSSHRSLSTRPNSPPVLCPSTDSLFYPCRLWGRRMECDVTLPTKHLARIWFGSDLKSDFKTPVMFSLKKKIWSGPLFSIQVRPNPYLKS